MSDSSMSDSYTRSQLKQRLKSPLQYPLVESTLSTCGTVKDNLLLQLDANLETGREILNCGVKASTLALLLPANVVLDTTSVLLDAVLPDPDVPHRTKRDGISLRETVLKAQTILREIPRRVISNLPSTEDVVCNNYMASLLCNAAEDLNLHPQETVDAAEQSFRQNFAKPVKDALGNAVDSISEIKSTRKVVGLASSLFHACQVLRQWMMSCADSAARRACNQVSSVITYYSPATFKSLYGHATSTLDNMIAKFWSPRTFTFKELQDELQIVAQEIGHAVVRMTPESLRRYTEQVYSMATSTIWLIITCIETYVPEKVQSYMKAIPGYSRLIDHFSHLSEKEQSELIEKVQPISYPEFDSKKSDTKVEVDQERSGHKQEIEVQVDGEQKTETPIVVEAKSKPEVIPVLTDSESRTETQQTPIQGAKKERHEGTTPKKPEATKEKHTRRESEESANKETEIQVDFAQKSPQVTKVDVHSDSTGRTTLPDFEVLLGKDVHDLNEETKKKGSHRKGHSQTSHDIQGP